MINAKTAERGNSARGRGINAPAPDAAASWEWFFPLWPPSVNDMYQTARCGRRVLKPEVRAFRVGVALEMHAARNAGKMPRPMYLVPVGVRLRFFLPDRRTHDVDNLLKCLFDACTKARLWRDDSLIFHMEIDKDTQILKGGGFEFEVWTLTPRKE